MYPAKHKRIRIFSKKIKLICDIINFVYLNIFVFNSKQDSSNH